jgi:type II secretory pathway component PulF
VSRAAQSNLPFAYVAASTRGRKRFGVKSARSERALAEQLKRDKLILLRSWRLPSWLASEARFSLKDQMQFNQQLAQLVGRGVPLVEALEVTARAARAPARPRIERIRESVAAGTGFADACQKLGGFDAVTAAVYRAAERTGDLAGACAQLAHNAKRTLAVSGKAATLMIYPAIVLTIGVIVGFAMLSWIVPKIGSALEQSGVVLPTYTKALMGIGDALRTYWYILLFVLFGGAIACIAARKGLAALIRRLMRRTPLLKEVVLAQESARFFSVMGAMARSGVPLADGLGVGVAAIGHPKLKDQLGTLRTRLIEGGVLRKLIDDVTALPLATRRLLIAAERSGDLESAFESLAEDMSGEVDRRAARLLAAFEPLLLVMLFVMIGSLLLSIMIPLMKATNQAF